MRRNTLKIMDESFVNFLGACLTQKGTERVERENIQKKQGRLTIQLAFLLQNLNGFVLKNVHKNKKRSKPMKFYSSFR